MKIEVCTGKACKSRFSQYITKRLENDIQKFNLEDMEITPCACTGNCKNSPNIIVDGKRHEYMNPLKASQIALEKTKK